MEEQEKYIRALIELQFSTRLFIYDKEKYIIMIIEDITPLVTKQNKIRSLSSRKLI